MVIISRMNDVVRLYTPEWSFSSRNSVPHTSAGNLPEKFFHARMLSDPGLVGPSNLEQSAAGDSSSFRLPETMPRFDFVEFEFPMPRSFLPPSNSIDYFLIKSAFSFDLRKSISHFRKARGPIHAPGGPPEGVVNPYFGKMTESIT